MKLATPFLFVLSLLAATAWMNADERPAPGKARLDVTKTRLIERPAEEVLADSSPAAVAPPSANAHWTIVTPDEAARMLVAAQVARLADRGKGDIEIPLKSTIIAADPLEGGAVTDNYAAASVPALPAFPAADPATGGFVNPKVEPGKVRWHADFASACAAAARSGKPVLLFQMMGKLDDRFC